MYLPGSIDTGKHPDPWTLVGQRVSHPVGLWSYWRFLGLSEGEFTKNTSAIFSDDHTVEYLLHSKADDIWKITQKSPYAVGMHFIGSSN